RCHAVDARVEEIEAEVRPPEEVAADELLRHGNQIVRQGDDVVAVPTDAAADVEQDPVEVRQYRGDLVRQRLGRVVVNGVEADQLLPRDRVSQVKLVGPDDVALRS